ncbi:sigma-54-dependent Fis family transcriptional regulator [Zhengella mangrovi]|uniref:Sigma-54-dependent Fis family transcriptional regulator n=1 Tax=Zhengella mangrovi TaxID=1982044 RepID=A0A2G1QPI0_9HYPH|nr:sigma-54 dependent transcriptional regulator [Zhengella mangrovi]PHP67457.1 sigma-54-dependent Fis family transcriptional regulator [Zhengella mangrovi]
MNEPAILVVEDSAALAETYRGFLRRTSSQCDLAGTGKEALSKCEARAYDCIVLDVNLPDMSGLDIMQSLRDRGNDTPVVIITANASIKTAVDVMRLGAFDFIVKPFNAERLTTTVCNAIDAAAPAPAPVPATPGDAGSQAEPSGFIGSSLAMQPVYRILHRAAPSNATVFVTGESGTGKEVCAEALHKLSKRASGPFVTINAAAIPKDLLESEMFGHIKGAFSGATADRLGACLTADGGTLFLDEICEMDLALQAKLLRFLQSRQVQRLGEDKVRVSDVRVVCATNRNPVEEVRAGRFREDLFYRLHVIPVELPPLRQRGEDVVEIARSFLRRFSQEDGKAFRDFSPDAAAILMAHGWPGNVRQLQNVIRSVVVLNDGDTVNADMLPLDMLGSSAEAPAATATAVPSLSEPLSGILAKARLMEPEKKAAGPIRPLEEVIRTAIETAIEACNGSIPRAAAALEVSPSTIYRRMETWKTDEEKDRAGIDRPSSPVRADGSPRQLQ